MKSLLTLSLRNEHDVVAARRRARDMAAQFGFDPQDQSRIATAVSEIARNAVSYGGGGQVDFSLEIFEPRGFWIRIADQGPGIADLSRILSGQYRSQTGMGLGIVGARRLLDHLDVQSKPGSGTTVTMCKTLPKRAAQIDSQALEKLVAQFATGPAQDVMSEVRQQNRDLLRALDELARRQEEFERLNAELVDTNRGVVALTAELDEKAEQLRRADQMKSRFLSHMSHEFRTPLNSILALCRLLQDQVDGPLSSEQQKQVGFIRRSAENLFELVNDLLDLAKVEAGKTDVRVSEFEVANVFGALRGVMKPLLTNEHVNFVIEDASGIPAMRTDEGKVAQVLRNFTSNALKFTERGEVRVSAKYLPESDMVSFSVSDTGIGIAARDQNRIFEEFAQIDNSIQSRVKGTGLGLPLSRKLAELMGGAVTIRSEVGKGSCFTATIPRLYSGSDAVTPNVTKKPLVLIVDDEEISRYLIRQALAGLPVEILEAGDGKEALTYAHERHPVLIFLDIRMPEKDGFATLAELKADPSLGGIPVVVVSSKVLTAEERSLLESQSLAVLAKGLLSEAGGASLIQDLVRKAVALH